MFKKICFCVLVSFSFNVFAEETVVQGPFPLKGVDGISIEFIKNNDESISLKEIISGKRNDVDNYAVGDGVPVIETVFFDKIRGKSKIVVLVSWDESNISAIHYKVNIYNYSNSGISGADECLNRDESLEGYDGYSGNGMIFNLKNAGEIKDYLHGELSKSTIPCR
ncbi:hypothetical protein LVQ78_22335 [Buttiauxella sp. A2-C2_NF]|uniref:hypothetical protein n=1 Tax=Buttiauxella ferragutiae TaxID=82989 RepID=UPI001E58D9A9|nr:hypothetical protein [Buttiauxella ferragutiae]MCE0828747.1 hypothetical protein [Buttiauxella ferragutiae]